MLYRFRLPGEAQKIDRIMNAFAVRYFLHNKTTVFKSSGANEVIYHTLALTASLSLYIYFVSLSYYAPQTRCTCWRSR